MVVAGEAGRRHAGPVPVARPSGARRADLVRLGTMPGAPQFRAVEFEPGTAADDAQEIDVVFSSDTPVARWFGMEILDHSAGAVWLDWLNSGRAHLLMEHDRTDAVGIIVAGSVKIGVDRKGRARVRFSNSARAREIYAEARDGFRPNVSVGYWIYEIQLEAVRDGVETYRVLSWEPYEISLVTVPADMAAQVERAAPAAPTHEITIFGDESMRASFAAPLSGARSASVQPEPAARGAAPAGGDPVAAERERIRSITALGRKLGCAAEAERMAFEGRSVAEFQGWLVERAAERNEASPLRPNSEIGMGAREVEQYSLFRAIRAAVSRDWSGAGLERAASDAVAQQVGKGARGFYIPRDVMTRGFLPVGAGARAGEMSTGNTGALVAQEHHAGEYIELLRRRTVAGQLGARLLSGLVGDVDIPKLSGGARTYWLNEGVAPTRSALAVSNVLMKPRTVAAEVGLTRRLLLQSSPNVEMLVREDLIAATALSIDRAVFHGTGLDGEPRGIFSTPGVGVVSLGPDGGPITYEALVDMETMVSAGDADIGNLAYVTHAYGRGAMKKIPRWAGSDRAIWEGGEVNGYRAVATNQIRADFTKGAHSTADLVGTGFGNFADVLIGEWGVVDVKPDEAGDAAAGGLILRVFQDVDVGIRHEQSFSIINDMFR
jgi:HK97 family phage major capsid protein/HK97 family phage prohead protease